MPVLNVLNPAGSTDSFGLSPEADHEAIIGMFIGYLLHAGREPPIPQIWFTSGGWEDWSDHGSFARDSPNFRGGDITVSFGDGPRSYALMNSSGGILISINTDV